MNISHIRSNTNIVSDFSIVYTIWKQSYLAPFCGNHVAVALRKSRYLYLYNDQRKFKKIRLL